MKDFHLNTREFVIFFDFLGVRTLLVGERLEIEGLGISSRCNSKIYHCGDWGPPFFSKKSLIFAQKFVFLRDFLRFWNFFHPARILKKKS